MSDEKISIGELESIRAKMTPGKYLRGEWYFEKDPDGRLAIDRPKVIQPSQSNGHIVSDVPDTAVITGCGCCGSPDASDEDADGLCAEHNAMPVLLEIAKAVLAERIAVCDPRVVPDCSPMHTAPHCPIRTARERVDAALGKVQL